jgi:inositol 1,4,5-triphosphate receptor type 1
MSLYHRKFGKIQQSVVHFFTSKMNFQGDVLRNFLLVRYFGRNFIQKKETVDLGKRLPIAVATHGPGGED